MATADLSIFSGLLQPPKTVADYDMQAASLQGKQTANATAGLNNQIAQRGVDRANQLLTLSKSLPQGSTDLDRLAALRNSGFYDEADKLSTSLDNRTKTVAGANKDNADAAATTAESSIKKKTAFLSGLSQFQNPDDVKNFLATGVQTGNLDMGAATQMISKVPSDPAAFNKWKSDTITSLMSPKDQTALTTPSADASLQATTSTSNNAATNATSRANNASTNATSRENNQATIGKDFKINGIDPQTGNFVGMGAPAPTGVPASGPAPAGNAAAPVSPMAGMIQALGTYKMDPSQAFSRMAPGMKANVIAQVQQQYPDYDPTTYAAKVKASRDFTTGPQGNQMRSFQVALSHLDQFGKLADALDNGDTNIINKVGNAIASQTGNPAPTNFDTAKAVVMKEVIKSIVQGGGGVGERQEAENLVNSAKGPKQLKGAITTLTNLMSAQHAALLSQRRAAGLPDSTLPNYTETPAASPAPPAGTGFKIIGVQ